MNDTALRWANLAEAATLVALFCVAMPLKYMAGFPAAVSLVGSIHGICFLLFIFVLMRALFMRSIGIPYSLALVVGAFIPFGGFINDYWMRKRQEV
ncbi:hypothetical protein BGP77_01930 [Saccharospirillum sp. MSK14-1]|uniref:DUF3817 domain-containing protein n=1 Tax=Saccharospirillum sp. MSK14-1 TaxID=1897632 RepID=UPI000D3D8A0A|nr:DUF3817 domain-containing protein [Saccharospirillum sp. MSK14-1]PTY36100.1 hypothetical protein BGP77_01930 [Saccharospirillum sp. MSK14-1]